MLIASSSIPRNPFARSAGQIVLEVNEIDDGYAYVSDETWESLLFLSGQNCIASVLRIAVTYTKQGPAYHTVKDASSVLWTRPAKGEYKVCRVYVIYKRVLTVILLSAM